LLNQLSPISLPLRGQEPALCDVIRPGLVRHKCCQA
jgi:hypothetical protein